MTSHVMMWTIAALTTAGVIIRPFHIPEAVWAVVGAALLVSLRLITLQDALSGVAKGLDVYLFLTGMMLLAEIARKEGLFDWLAAVATSHAAGSPSRLFLLTYTVGTVVTIFLSNDATAVVLTPAVAAAVNTAGARPLPYLMICAFIANAASFVLPISNPANLVIYGSRMPPLAMWLPAYGVSSALSIIATFVVLRWSQRRELQGDLNKQVPVPPLSTGGLTAALAIAATGVVLLVASAFDLALGLPTAIAGGVTAVIVLIRARQSPWPLMREISWSVLPLVAGLFVLVEALGTTGVITSLARLLGHVAQSAGTGWAAGIGVALASNVMNNLPVGLIAGSALQDADVPDRIVRAVLIGVDVGPNLSVTGSLATILWLTALRREGEAVSAGAFLKLGLLVMPPALLLAIGAALLLP